MPDFKMLGAFIGWVGGALAGITALLYAIGFVATLYHLNLMGIDTELVSRDGFVYVGRGAVALNKAFLFIFIGAFFAGLILLVYDRALSAGAGLLSAIWRRVRGRPVEISAFASACLLMLLALALLVVAVSSALQPALGAAGILFTRAPCADGGVRLICDTSTAEERFGDAAVFAGLILILTWVGAARVVGETLGRHVLRAAYAFIAILVVFFMIPVAYGVLVIREQMPRVALQPSDAARLGLEGRPLQLLRQDSSGSLLWMPLTRELQWIAPGELKTLRLSRTAPSAAQRGAAP